LPPLTRPPPAEASEDRAHGNARTGCPLAAAHKTAASRSQRRPSSRKRADGFARLPAHAPDRRQPKLTMTELTGSRGRCPCVAAHATSADRSQRRPSSRRRSGRVSSVPPLTRSAPTEANDERARVGSWTVSVHQRSRDRRRPKPTMTELAWTRGRCPFATARRPRPAEAGTGRHHAATPRRVSVDRDPRTPRRPKPERTLRAVTSGRVPGHRHPRNPRRPKPMRTLRATTPGRVPGHRHPRNPHRPKPAKTLRATTPGRVSPFPLHQLTIEWTDVTMSRMCQPIPFGYATAAEATAAHPRKPDNTSANHGSAHDRSGRSASHTAQLSLCLNRAAMRTS
jgi:hypothetical protein